MSKPKKNKDKISKKKLSILIRQDGLSFCVSDLSEDKTTTFVKKKFDKALDPAQILQQIISVFNEKDLDWDTVAKTRVIFSNPLYSFVPRALFDKNYLSDYLKFNTKILTTDFISYDELEVSSLNNVYIPYANINNYFFDKFGSFEYEHASSVLVENLLPLENETGKVSMYVNVYGDYFDMVVVESNQLLLANTFSFEAPEDFLYYILFVAEQLKLDPEKFPLKFLGNLSKESEIFKICYTYVRNCSFLEEEESLKNEFKFSEPSLVKPNYVLLKTHACV